VKASYESAYGKIVSNWEVKEGKIFMEVEVPAGTTAIVIVPGKAGEKVVAGKYRLTGDL
jgi:alpha-L-rhamnosidase